MIARLNKPQKNPVQAESSRKPASEPHAGDIASAGSSTMQAMFDQSPREAQRSLIESGDISSAVQINQLGYAFDPEFRKTASTSPGRAARESYNAMIENMSQVSYAKGLDLQTVDVDATARAEMYLARIAAETGDWPTKQQITDAKEKFGIMDDE